MLYYFTSTIADTDALAIIPLFKDTKKREFAEIVTQEHMKGERGELFYTLLPHEAGVRRAVLAGLGDSKKLEALQCAQVYASAMKLVQDKKHTQVHMVIPEQVWDRVGAPREFGETLARLIGLTTYQYTAYITDTERHLPQIEKITFVGVPKAKQKQFLEGLKIGAIINGAVCAARDMGNSSPVHMHPEALAAEAVRLSKGIAKLTTRVLSKKEIEAEGMGALLGVASGSVRPPTFIIMEYRGGKAKDAPAVLVGKGVTFDAGGISIKPSAKMDEMKYDMLGGATVIATILAAATLKLPVNVVALVPATENLPSGSAMRPGDVLRSHSGKTIEVLDTDAEGRLILADALSYAKRYNPKFVVDVATLTGACVVALGESRAGVWSSDDRLAAKLEAASQKTGEKIWRMPLGEEYSTQVKSEVADVKNITERWGSANTAAAFLQEFSSGAWAHVDIAGVMTGGKLQPARRAGASGWGVALLLELIKR